MKVPFGVVALSVCLAAAPWPSAADGASKESRTGSIPVAGKHSVADLTQMAKVSMVDAEKTALAAIEAKDKLVTSREIEVEHGYLVYSFDIQVAGKPGVEEVQVDAGNGKVLAREHESARSEAREKKKAEKPR